MTINLDDMAFDLEQKARLIEVEEIAELQRQIDMAKEEVAKLYAAAAILHGENKQPEAPAPAPPKQIKPPAKRRGRPPKKST